MYEDFSNEIPDSDMKIYMSLDDIIHMEKKHKRPGSVKSMASHRSVYSNRSRRSAYSNKSRRSTYSNKSAYSNRSRKSTYSNKAQHFTYQNRFQGVRFSGNQQIKRIGGRQRVGRKAIGFEPNSTTQYKVLDSVENMFVSHSMGSIAETSLKVTSARHREKRKRESDEDGERRPGAYTPTNQIKYYKNKVRQAIKTLSGPFNRNRFKTGLRKVLLNGQISVQRFGHNKGNQRMMWKKPSLIRVEMDNIPPLMTRRIPYNNSGTLVKRHHNIRGTPLTKQTLALFNKMNRKTYSCSSSQYLRYMNSNQSQYSDRHSIKASLNSRVQNEIQIIQSQFAEKHSRIEKYDMNFFPTPCTTELLIGERFSTFD